MQSDLPTIPFGPQLPVSSMVLPPDAALGEHIGSEFRWQALRMPPVSRLLLLERGNPLGVDPEDLMRELGLSDDALAEVRRALATKGDVAMIHAKALLPPAACCRLREAVDAEIQQKADTVVRRQVSNPGTSCR